LDFAVANAGCADANALASAFDNGVDALQIQIPATLRNVVGVAYFMAELGSAAADITNF
jgi:hypothetical protein